MKYLGWDIHYDPAWGPLPAGYWVGWSSLTNDYGPFKTQASAKKWVDKTGGIRPVRRRARRNPMKSDTKRILTAIGITAGIAAAAIAVVYVMRKPSAPEKQALPPSAGTPSSDDFIAQMATQFAKSQQAAGAEPGQFILP